MLVVVDLVSGLLIVVGGWVVFVGLVLMLTYAWRLVGCVVLFGLRLLCLIMVAIYVRGNCYVVIGFVGWVLVC